MQTSLHSELLPSTMQFFLTSLRYLHANSICCPQGTESPSMPTESTTTDLKLLIAADLAASHDLASRITQLRNAIDSGQPPPRKTVDLMDRSNRDITRDLVRRIEDIESATPSTKDRELLQALNDRLAVCDGLAMRLAELRDLITSISKGSSAGNYNSSSNNRSISAPAIDTDAPERQRSAHPARFKSHDSDPENGDDDGDEEEENASSDSPSDPDPEPDPRTYPLLYRILSIPPSTPASLMPSVAKSYSPLSFLCTMPPLMVILSTEPSRP